MSKRCRVVAIDPEDDWEEADAGEALLRAQGVRPAASEEVRFVCLEGDVVLGALAVGLYSSEPDEGDPHGRPRFSFSAAVHPASRRKGVARDLIGAMLRAYDPGEVLLEGKVINPDMARLLEALGFVYDDQETAGDAWTDLDRRIGRRMYLP